MGSQDSNITWELFPGRSEMQKQKCCAKAKTWQLAFLVGILILVSTFSLFSLVYDRNKKQTEPEKSETLLINEDYASNGSNTKNLTVTEQLELTLAGKVAKNIRMTLAKNHFAENTKIKCWRSVMMKAVGDAQMGELVGGLHVGRSIAIRGRVKPHPKSFNVDLLMGSSNSSDVALSLNPRMNATSNKVVFGRNSFLSGSWGLEERKLDKFPFAPGFYFEMKIHCGANAFTVSVNCVRLLEYKYRVDLDRITHVRVFGDLNLLFVKLK